MFRVFKQMDVRNRAYVVDLKGNKVFYGTMYQCGKFIEYMKGEVQDDRGCIERGNDEGRKNGCVMDTQRKAMC